MKMAPGSAFLPAGLGLGLLRQQKPGNMGDVMGDLQTRRAMIMGMEADSGFQKIKAKVPLKEMQRYSTALSSISGGRATFTMSFSGYEKVPSEVQEDLLKDYHESEEDE